MLKWRNQFGRALDHRSEFDKLAKLNKDMPNFEDDPAAELSGDKYGRFERRSLADGQLQSGVDMGRYRGNGE